jgi:hypothetical protein
VTIYDLAFVLLVLGSAACAIVICILLLRGRVRSAGRWALTGISVWLGYLVLGSLIAVATPQRVVPMGQERCFDEMCFRVAAAERIPSANGADPRRMIYKVTIEETNRSRGRAERERRVGSSLVDSSNARYWPVAGGNAGQAGLDTTLESRETLAVTQVFEVPSTASELGVVIDHSYALNPGRIKAGDEDHVLHKPTKMLIQP